MAAALPGLGFFEELSGAGYQDELHAEAEPTETGSWRAQIITTCRGYYPDPSDPSSHIPPGACGSREVLVAWEGRQVGVSER